MISVALIFLSSLVLKLIGAFLKIHFLEQHMYYFSDMTSPLMLIASVSLFVYMKNLNIPNSRIINYVATLSFPVYLLHDNQYCLDLLYKKVLCTSSYYNANTLILILMLMVYVISLFAIADIIEIPRKLLEKLIFKCRKFNSVAKKVDRWFDLQKVDAQPPKENGQTH